MGYGGRQERDFTCARGVAGMGGGSRPRGPRVARRRAGAGAGLPAAACSCGRPLAVRCCGLRAAAAARRRGHRRWAARCSLQLRDAAGRTVLRSVSAEDWRSTASLLSAHIFNSQKVKILGPPLV
ncbi:hypothetical protein PVAP13_6KG029980 [Panicum virgatum]|uniref:Uncharacterized protein n=1 Tax=Panicum virgatum TaxID=38727 RepID=A0A8T0R6R7_PANVG|nr:hypothetical protein PVAP13_6KG029980 [Panicum virgatum]